MGIVKLYVALIFCFVLTNGSAQDKLPETTQPAKKQAELGATLCTINSLDMIDEKFNVLGSPKVEFINGLFFRYSFNRFALRSQISYSKNTLRDNFYEELFHRDFKAQAGLQFSLIKKSHWLYSFVDAGFRNIKERASTEHYFDALETRITKQNGLSCNVGFGSKITVLKCICISPEIAIDMYCSKNSVIFDSPYESTTYANGNKSFITQPIAKLHLTVKF